MHNKQTQTNKQTNKQIQTNKQTNKYKQTTSKVTYTHCSDRHTSLRHDATKTIDIVGNSSTRAYIFLPFQLHVLLPLHLSFPSPWQCLSRSVTYQYPQLDRNMQPLNWLFSCSVLSSFFLQGEGRGIHTAQVLLFLLTALAFLPSLQERARRPSYSHQSLAAPSASHLLHFLNLGLRSWSPYHSSVFRTGALTYSQTRPTLTYISDS